MDRKNELKEQYRQMKPEMGVFLVRARRSSRVYLESTPNLRSALNSCRFKLGAGVHPNQSLQQDWSEQGEENFTLETLEVLPYSEDETKTDYQEELESLRLLWEERLTKENLVFYPKGLKGQGGRA